MSPTVSVVIPFYNRSQFIGHAVGSVLAQTRPVDEIIIVDDGSRPEEAAALDRFRDSCIVVQQGNGGPAAARNTGVARASGEWISFLDDDDGWEPNRLEVLMSYLERHPECSALHHAVRLDGSQVVFRKAPLSLKDFLHAHPSPASTSTVLIRRSALLKCGLMNPVMSPKEDHDCFVRLAMHHSFHYVDEPLTVRRLHQDNISNDVARECAAAIRMFSCYESLYSSRADYLSFLRKLNVVLGCRCVYARRWRTLGKILSWSRGQGIGRLGLTGRIAAALLRNRMSRSRGIPTGGFNGACL